MEHENTVTIELDGTEIDIVKHEGIVAAELDSIHTIHTDYTSVGLDATLDFVYQLLTSSGRMPRLMNFSICCKPLYINSVSEKNSLDQYAMIFVPNYKITVKSIA